MKQERMDSTCEDACFKKEKSMPDYLETTVDKFTFKVATDRS